jgi:hypothetical protein
LLALVEQLHIPSVYMAVTGLIPVWVVLLLLLAAAAQVTGMLLGFIKMGYPVVLVGVVVGIPIHLCPDTLRREVKETQVALQPLAVADKLVGVEEGQVA